MGTTAIDEQRGGSVEVTLGSPTVYQASLPSGPGGVRLYVVRPTVAGSSFRLPNPAYCSVGSEPICVVINKGTQSINIASFGGVVITGLAANRAVEAYLGVAGIDSWNLNGPFVVSSSGALNALRKPFELVYTASTTGGTHFRVDTAKQFGYIGADGPVALTVTVKTGAVLGQADLGPFLLGSPPAGTTTGPWPAGSTCLITVESGAYIQGRGGGGGAPATPPLNPGGNGQQGGAALECLINTVVINNGFVRGGGGGGGAGNRITSPASILGGFGGGGAGAPGGSNGTGANAGTIAATLETGGSGGQLAGGYAGGPGGAPGQAGSAGFGLSGATGGAGGAAGPAIRRRSSVTVTQLGGGVYAGGTITFL